jgi:hypothetical protein
MSHVHVAGETADAELEVKNLDKSWIYEFLRVGQQ